MLHWYWLIMVGVVCFAAGAAASYALVLLAERVNGIIDQAAKNAGPWVGSG